VDGSMYILGLNTTHHSLFNLEAQSTYMRHVAGRWTAGKTVSLGHSVNKELHWWKDIVNTLAAPELKSPESPQASEISEVFEAGWLTQEEEMTPEYLRYIDKWTKSCLKAAKRGSRSLEKCKRHLSREHYTQWRDLYDRSLMCMELRRNAAICYWGKRIWERDGGEYRSRRLQRRLVKADRALADMIERYRNYDKPYPSSAWDWKSDMEKAESYRFRP